MQRAMVTRVSLVKVGDRIRISGTGDYTVSEIIQSEGCPPRPGLTHFRIHGQGGRVIVCPTHEHILVIEENDD